MYSSCLDDKSKDIQNDVKLILYINYQDLMRKI